MPLPRLALSSCRPWSGGKHLVSLRTLQPVSEFPSETHRPKRCCCSWRSDCCSPLHSEQLVPTLTATVGASGVWIPDPAPHLPMLFGTCLCQPVGIAAESPILEPELIKAADQLLLWPLPWRVARARGISPRFCFPHPAAIQPRNCFSYLNMGAAQPLSVFSLPLTSYPYLKLARLRRPPILLPLTADRSVFLRALGLARHL